MLLFMYTLYITMLCLFKAQYVHYEGNNLQQKGDEYTVKRLYLFAPCRKHREYRTIQSIKTGPSVSFFYFMNVCTCMCVCVCVFSCPFSLFVAPASDAATPTYRG